MCIDSARARRHRLVAVVLGLVGCDDLPPPSFVSETQTSPSDAATVETRDSTTRQDLTPTEVAPEDSVPSDAITDVAGGPETDVTTTPSRGVVVNEVDCRGLPLDWVEVINTDAMGIDLGGMIATDSLSDETRFVPLGDVVLGPGERRVVLLDRFGVKCGEDGVALLANDRLVATAGPTANPPSTTWGRVPDGTGAFTVTIPTPGAPNARSSLDPNDPMRSLFDPVAPPVEIELGLEALAYAALLAEPREWVPATFSLTDRDGTTTLDVGLKLKGQRSFKPLGQKAAFKVDFNRLQDTTFRGLESLTLNNSRQDDGRINEALAYSFFRRSGVRAPRVGYAWVEVNGEAYGLYNNVENPDDRWMDDQFESSLALFEGVWGVDIVPDEVPLLQLKEGPESARLVIAEVAAALQDAFEHAPPTELMAATSGFIAWPEVIAFMSSEIVVGHWDGYVANRNNYLVHLDAAGRIRLVPWGLDQTFEKPVAPYAQRGILHRACVRDPACRAALEDAVLAHVATVQAGTSWAALAPLPALLQPYVDREPGAQGDNVGVGLDLAKAYLLGRSLELARAIACVRDPLEDIDGDGHACDTDCDEGDPEVNMSAVEVCGDGIDQDCTGVADDLGCPECQDFARDDRVYRFCWRPRTYLEARAFCVEGDGIPVVINDKPENDWVGDQAYRLGLTKVWIGLTDRATEGVYLWEDGRRMTDGFEDYGNNEPNDYGSGEDCTELDLLGPGNEEWNDVTCDTRRPVVCEQVGSP